MTAVLALIGLVVLLALTWVWAGPLVVLYVLVAVPLSIWFEMRRHRRWIEGERRVPRHG